MRASLFLLGGMLLVGAGIALIAAGVPGRWLVGPLLIVVGLLLKVVGVLVSDDDAGAARREGARTPTTLGGDVVDRPRAGIPAGRASLRAVGSRRAAPASREERRAS